MMADQHAYEWEKKAKVVLDRLSESGHLAFFVGGYVRDRVIGRPVKDIDIATSALPEQVIDTFPHTVPTGLQHGTVTVLMDGTPIEVTTFRVESEYEQHRRPKRVDFVGELDQDLARRDFTMNAMAMDRDGRLIDPFGGRDDIRRGIVRCVGEPDERFREDALRLIRCIRFAAEYSFEVDPATSEALLRQRPGLKDVAMERVRMELERIVEGSHPERGLAMFAKTRLPEYLKRPLPVAPTEWSFIAREEHLHSFRLLAAEDLRWTHLLLLLGLQPDEGSQMLSTLTFSGKRRRKIAGLLKFQRDLEWAADRRLGEKQWRTWWIKSVLQADRGIPEDWLVWTKALTDEHVSSRHPLRPAWLEWMTRMGAVWLKEMPVRSQADLVVGGADLMELRETPGPWIGHMLQQLTEDVALGEVDNDRLSLMAQAKRRLEDDR